VVGVTYVFPNNDSAPQQFHPIQTSTAQPPRTRSTSRWSPSLRSRGSGRSRASGDVGISSSSPPPTTATTRTIMARRSRAIRFPPSTSSRGAKWDPSLLQHRIALPPMDGRRGAQARGFDLAGVESARGDAGGARDRLEPETELRRDLGASAPRAVTRRRAPCGGWTARHLPAPDPGGKFAPLARHDRLHAVPRLRRCQCATSLLAVVQPS
jgi:hypothetical protein